MCGLGEQGQLGIGQTTKEWEPKKISMIPEPVVQVSCGIVHTLILTESGIVYATGGGSQGQLGTGSRKEVRIPVKVKELERLFITKIACCHHSAAITDEGYLYVWGTSVFGEFMVPTQL